MGWCIGFHDLHETMLGCGVTSIAGVYEGLIGAPKCAWIFCLDCADQTAQQGPQHGLSQSSYIVMFHAAILGNRTVSHYCVIAPT
jgi:hypothetical protein